MSKVFAKNKKARHEYFIEETYEAGIELKGTEVKSVKAGKVSVKEAFVDTKNGEVFVNNMHISPYKEGNIQNVDPIRRRKLLLHKNEINKLVGKVTQAGYTIVVLSVYDKNGLIKLEIALAKGKKLHDKRETIKNKEAKRAIERAIKNY
ncbi:MAG: SsrA-binding protein SmpB [Tissierellia bacterium]|nr:SsrA-binding protein SmpB [Tissierellia bacterium]